MQIFLMNDPCLYYELYAAASELYTPLVLFRT